ncbi:lysozyme [Devosia sp. WQ 349K1]|uniref:lysozyme n=1 Tax=Devosia sp. WQ 349K1 TaxID=2800329 RepID=UPI001AED59D7|nr:lysozyme [Devosia sp. WQ 349K1]
MVTQLPADFLAFSKQWEGFRADAYPDPGSRDGTPWTIGYGQTVIDGVPVKKGDTITEARATQLLQQRHNTLAARALSVVRMPLSPYQLATLVSFADNVGWGGGGKIGFSNSTLLKKLNSGDYSAVPGELAKWKYNDGKVMEGLINRRAAEAGLWVKGSFVSSAPVDAKPGNPLTELMTPERMAAGGGLLGGAAAIASGNGPVQYAMAALMVIAAITIAIVVIRKATR